MATYVQAVGKDTWHWCRNCSKYPYASNIGKTQNTRPSWDLCDECKDKEKNNTCNT